MRLLSIKFSTFKTLAVLCILSSLSIASFAKGLRDENEMRQVGRQFADALTRGDIEGAKNAVKPFMPLPDAELNKLFLKIKGSEEESKRNHGSFVGITPIDEKSRGGILFRYSFAEKFDRNPVIWDLYFYKPRTEWQVHSIFWTKDAQKWMD